MFHVIFIPQNSLRCDNANIIRKCMLWNILYPTFANRWCLTFVPWAPGSECTIVFFSTESDRETNFTANSCLFLLPCACVCVRSMHFTSPLHQRSVSNICSWHWWQWCRLRHKIKPLVFVEYGNVSYFLKYDMMICWGVSVLPAACVCAHHHMFSSHICLQHMEKIHDIEKEGCRKILMRHWDQMARRDSLMWVLSFCFSFV